QFVTRHPGFAGREDMVLYQKYAAAIARRAPGPGSPAAKLERLLSDILVDHVWMLTIRGTDGKERLPEKHYYTTKQPIDTHGYGEFSSIIRFEGKERSQTIKKEWITYIGMSPQSKIAAQYKPMLADESKLARWETIMIELVGTILSQSDIDPILQLALLRKV